MALLKLTLFHTKAVGATKAATTFKKQIESGNAFLKQFGIQYHRYPADSSLELDYDTVLDAKSKVNPGLQQRLELRQKANAKYYSTEGRLPVILCKIGGSGGGEAPGSIDTKLDWLPFVIMDPDTINADGLTLTHEAGHCCGLKHPGTPPFGEPRLMQNGEPMGDNFMAYGTFDIATQSWGARSLSEIWQINALRTAYFYSA